MPPDSPETILARLFSRTTKGIKLGLDRMKSAAERIGSPQNSFSSIHVAGTNGKGSVCSFLEAGLRSYGKRVGLYTSPHLVRFEERFVVDGQIVGESDWLEVYRDIEAVIFELDLTFFEAATLIAFELFKRRGVEWAVLETGLGGRLDATNIVEPKAAVITAIAMDHMEYLGDDLLGIAGEKLGIVKADVPLVMQDQEDERIMELAVRTCEKLHSSLQIVRCPDRNTDQSLQRACTTYTINVLGEYQLFNLATALECLDTLGFDPTFPAVAEAMERVDMPGRFQTFPHESGKTVVLDVGHNPQAARKFAATMRQRFEGRRVAVVVGVMKDKDIAGVLDAYCSVAHIIVLTQPDVERAATVHTLANLLPAGFTGEVKHRAMVAKAFEDALESDCDIVCVCGSFYTVGEVMQALGIY